MSHMAPKTITELQVELLFNKTIARKCLPKDTLILSAKNLAIDFALNIISEKNLKIFLLRHFLHSIISEKENRRKTIN